MKICFITNLYPPYARGGAEAVVEQEARALAKDGHEVIIITAAPCPEYLLPSSCLENGIKVWRLFPPNLFFYGNIGRHNFLIRVLWHLVDLFNLGSALIVRNILRRERPEVAHTHNLKGLGFLVPWVIKNSRIPHVHTLHDAQLVEPSGIILADDERDTLLRRVFSFCTKKLFSSPTAVISPSKWLLEFYASRGFFPKSKKVVLENPLSFSVIASEAKPSVAIPTGLPRSLQDLAMTKKQFSFLYVGQIEKHKGIDVLLDAWQELKDVVAELRIVGDGAYLATARERAKNMQNIKFVGRVSTNEVLKFLSEADALVVPSVCLENAPTVISLARAAGVPVIASRVGGIPEMIKEGENGFLVPPGDKEALAKAMLYCVTHREKIETMRLAMTKQQNDQSQNHTAVLTELYSKLKNPSH